MVAKLQHRGRARLDAELVFDRHALHVVARTQRAVAVDQELRHHEQRDALDPLGRTRGTRQHQVDNVVRHVMLAVGNEDLGAEHLVAAVSLRLGAGAQQRQVGAGLRLGQIHGAGPLAGDQARQEALLQFVRASGEQRFDRAVGKHGAQRERQVGRVHHFHARRADQLGQALATKLDRVHDALPAALAELAERFREAGGGPDFAVVPAAGLLVAGNVEGGDHLAVELCGFADHGFDGVGGGVFIARQAGNLCQSGQFTDDEQDVFGRCGVAHSRPLCDVHSAGIRFTNRWHCNVMCRS
ncbi:hypothetical protein D9M72_300000 [compost metagenome]